MTVIVKRAYTGTNVQMLTVLHTLAANAKEHQPDLQAIISTYTPEFLGELDTRIRHVTETYFGKDAAYNLRKITALLNGLQKEALEDLSLLKLVIEQRFRTDSPFIAAVLKDLGYTSFYRAAQKRSQEAIVQLLAQFRQHMTEELKGKIVAAGAQAAMIERIVAKGNELHAANVSQEVFKDNKKSDTHEAITQFNDLYQDMMGVAKIGARAFKNNAPLKDKFNYSKHLKALTGAPSASTVAKQAKAKKEVAAV